MRAGHLHLVLSRASAEALLAELEGEAAPEQYVVIEEIAEQLRVAIPQLQPGYFHYTRSTDPTDEEAPPMSDAAQKFDEILRKEVE